MTVINTFICKYCNNARMMNKMLGLDNTSYRCEFCYKEKETYQEKLNKLPKKSDLFFKKINRKRNKKGFSHNNY